LIDYPTGIDTQFVYDAAGRKIQVIDKTGQYDYAYNDRGDLVSVTYPAVGTNPRRVVSYQYDAIGRVVKRSFTGYGDTTYLYDDAGRMVSLTTPDGKTFSFAYNDASALVQESYPNGTVAVYSYNPKGFLVSLQNKKSDGSVISGFSYVLDSSGNRLKVTEVPSGETVEYGYDGIYQLIRETRKDIAGNVILDIGYEYDLNGNRVRMVDYKNGGEVVYSYNALDQMLSAGNISFGYDGNGNVIRKVVSGQETQYLWDYEDKMERIVYPNGSVNEFETNYEGKRRKKVDSSGVTYFYYDGDKLLAEVDGSDNLLAVYEWGVRGLLSQFRNGVRYYYHLDGLGSVVQVTNESQVVVASYKYDAWGNDLVDPQSLIPNPFKYVGGLGYYSDKESGLKLLGVRYYDSQIGKFWSLDPIKEGRNWYGYANSNPVQNIDPTGLSCLDQWDFWRDKTCWVYWFLRSCTWRCFSQPIIKPIARAVLTWIVKQIEVPMIEKVIYYVIHQVNIPGIGIRTIAIPIEGFRLRYVQVFVEIPVFIISLVIVTIHLSICRWMCREGEFES
jgi:RHS repeat-associated protein